MPCDLPVLSAANDLNLAQLIASPGTNHPMANDEKREVQTHCEITMASGVPCRPIRPNGHRPTLEADRIRPHDGVSHQARQCSEAWVIQP